MSLSSTRPLSFIFFVLGILVLSGSTSLAQQKESYRAPTAADGTLEWKFTKGQTIKMTMDQDVETSVNMAGNDMKSTNTAINEISLSITDVDNNGVASANYTIDRMKISVKAPGASIEFDTAVDKEPSAEAAEIAGMIEPLVGKEMKQKMDKSGNVFDIELPEGMFDGAASNPMAAAMFNENTIKEMAKKFGLKFPQAKPEVGFKWEETVEMDMGPAKVATDTKYEYLGIAEVDGKPQHVILAEVFMSFPDGISGLDVNMKDENSKAMFYFDGVAGQLTKTTMDQNVTMEIEVPGQTIVQTLKQKVTTKFTAGK